MGITGNSPKKSKVATPEKSDVKEETKDQAAEKLDNKEENVHQPANNAEKGVEKVIPKTEEKSKAKSLSVLKKAKHVKDVKIKKGILSKEALEITEECLQEFFLESFGKSSSKVFDVVSAHAQLQTYNNGGGIISKGEAGKGVHVILKGKVGVTTSDSTITIDTLQTGDIFGEMSSMYDIPSTANVVALSEVIVAFVPKPQFRKLLEEFDANMDIIDWCIHRRYLPTSDFIDSERTYRRMAFKFLRKLEFFMAWPDNALKTLILSFEHRLVVLYPAESMIIIEGDPLSSMTCLIKGTAEVCRGPREIVKIEVNRRNKSFVYGESGITGDNEVATISLRTREVCQVILIPKGKVLNVTEEFPSLHNDLLDKNRDHLQFVKRLGHVYKQYQPDLQAEVLLYLLQQSDHYADNPEAEVRNKVRQGVYTEFYTGSAVFLDVERESIEAFLVIRGEVEISKADEIAEDESETEKLVMSERTVVVLKTVKMSSIRTTCPTLILKLPKVIRRPSQEQDNLELV